MLKPSEVEERKIQLEVDKIWYSFDVEDEKTPGYFTVCNYPDPSDSDDPDDASPPPRSKDAKLLDHPYLANRFITNPPISEVDVDEDKSVGGFDVKNDGGVTVHDVYSEMTDK